MSKLREGTAELGIEIGRWHGLRREDRVYKECGTGEVEDTEHFVMRCAYVVNLDTYIMSFLHILIICTRGMSYALYMHMPSLIITAGYLIVSPNHT